MSIFDSIRSLRKSENSQKIVWRVDPEEGLDFIFLDSALENQNELAINDPYFGFQLTYLKSAQEQGYADANRDGFTIPASIVPRLDADFIALFDLPPLYTGQYRMAFHGNTGSSSFKAVMELMLSDGSVVSHFSLHGPFLKLAEGELYRLSEVDWSAISHLCAHELLEARDKSEYKNNYLIYQLQTARSQGMLISLAQFSNLEISVPNSIGVSIEYTNDGGLHLTPAYGPGMNSQEINNRLGQIGDNADEGILRVKNKIVLLDTDRLDATHEILKNTRISKEQVASFLSAPTAYLNAALIDLDTGFSWRAHGAEIYTHRYFGDTETTPIDWFASNSSVPEPFGFLANTIHSKDSLEEVNALLEGAKINGATVIQYGEKLYDIASEQEVDRCLSIAMEKIEQKSNSLPQSEDESSSGEEALEKAVISIDTNDEVSTHTRANELEKFRPEKQEYTKSQLKRAPYPHQNIGIKWLLAHAEISRVNATSSGALLADDMGLGKTYMTLVAISEAMRRDEEAKISPKPTLIVAPLSLIENWQDEISETFEESPFSDIVVLQIGGDLSKYKIKGSKQETNQEFIGTDIISDMDKIRYSLKVGSGYGHDRLDSPKRLVLTTYQTLRDYQFSLSRIDWGFVVFDEAQNLKNPNTLATRAAKGLKADFKLLATGTPVENSLKDFWCLLDTAVPGLLGAWQSFRTTYVEPILNAEPDTVHNIKLQIGRDLREAVGDYMLRRSKADELDGLPAKTVFSGDSSSSKESFLPILSSEMSGTQLQRYDEIINQVKSVNSEKKQGAVLASLTKLRICGIHPEIAESMNSSLQAKQFISHAFQSSKLKSLISLLDKIKGRNEKVLIFATTKAVQAYVSTLLGIIYNLRVEIVNGDTKAVSSKKDEITRKKIIDAFQLNVGFGVLVMSPIAAGVGLNIVEANNVIHLERHWNPAKEAQATDRVYRIGQKRPVNVYLPMALHPTSISFDLHLNTLLENKVNLSDAVVAPSVVEASDIMSMF